MAGRKAHVQSNEGFDQFIQSIPEDARGRGYWRIRMEKSGTHGGGVLQVICGFLEYEPGETYESLRDRVKRSFADQKGPGVYFAIPCDQEKKEIKNVDKARFEYKESEVEMPEIPGTSDTNPLGDTLKTVKKAARDMADLQSLDLQQKILNKFLGDKDDKKKEDETVKDSASAGNNISDLLMWKTFMDDGSKKKEAAAPSTEPSVQQQLQQQLMDAKLQTALAEMRAKVDSIGTQIQARPDDRFERLIEKSQEETRRILEKLADAQKPREDDRMTRLLDKLVENHQKPPDDKLERLIEKMNEDNRRLLEKMSDKESSSGKENAIQSMMALMVKQQEEERRTRADDEKRREDNRREEDKRRDQERAERERIRVDDEKKRIEEQKEERRRSDDDRKAERSKTDDQIKLERQKFEEELKEQRRRFDEDMKLRRDEMKHEEEKTRLHSNETQKFQLQLLDVFKNKNDSSLDLTAKIVDTMTNAGMSSMKTAQSAAETIMDVAKAAAPRDKDKGGIGEILKDVGQIAGPLLAPYANADAQLKMLQSAAQISGQAQQASAQQQRRAEVARREAEARRQREIQAARAKAQAAPKEEETAEGVSGIEETGTPKEESSMIAEYLARYPIIKEALVDNLADGLGVDVYIGVVTGLNQPTLESLIASLRPRRLMDYVKQACTDEEKKLVDANELWFQTLRKEMVLEIRGDEEPEGDGQPAPEATKP